jgi:rubrerythrin
MSPAKTARKVKTRRAAAKRGVPGRKSAGARTRGDRAGFLARAWSMEVEAAERYAMLADAMEEHNNRDVAELFRKLARIEQLHADQLVAESPSGRPPGLPAGGMRWDEGEEGPETADPGELHYRMQPYHALAIALACEKRANRFFANYARKARNPAVRKAAKEMAEEEAGHVRLIEDWLKRTPEPARDWDDDPDPPALSD